MPWSPPLVGVLKFNVDGAVEGKLGPAVVGGVLHDSDGVVLALFSKHVGHMESNEVEVVAILEALHIFGLHFLNTLSFFFYCGK